MKTQDTKQITAGGFVTISNNGLSVMTTLDGPSIISDSASFQKCSDCGHEAYYPEVDLWTRCNVCHNNLVTDEGVMSFEEVDPLVHD